MKRFRTHTVKLDVLWEVNPPGQYLVRYVRVPDEQGVPARRRNDEHVTVLLKLRILGVEGPVHVEEVQIFPPAQAKRQPLDYRPPKHHRRHVERVHTVHRLHEHRQARTPRAMHIIGEGGDDPEDIGPDTNGNGNEDTHSQAEQEKDGRARGMAISIE